MEKDNPHCPLIRVKALPAARRVRVTLSALTGGAALGFEFEGILGVVLVLRPADFYKSMTT